VSAAPTTACRRPSPAATCKPSSTNSPPPHPPPPPHTNSSEAASILERTIAAIEAMITSRRTIGGAAAPAEEPKSAADLLKAQMMGTQPGAPPQQAGTGPGAGNGFEILLQGFNWESHKRGCARVLLGAVGGPGWGA